MAAPGLVQRRGFTLIELLVVLPIMVILIGLLFPAVQKVREAAARLHCASKLRQLALGVQQYHDAERRFPYGQFGGKYGSGPDSAAWSWLARLLPYLEQGALNQHGSIPAKTLRQSAVANRPIAVLLCPSDSSSATGPRTDAGNLYGFPVGQTNYKGVSGANWGDDLEGIGPHFNTDWRHPGTNGSFDGLSNGDGIFYRVDYRRVLTLAHVTDGASNTFLIGEDVPGKTQWCSWPYANNAYGTCAIPPNVTRPGGGDYPDWKWANNWSFRSRHAGGLHFAFADGSVRFISNSISLPAYHALATITGSEPVSPP